MALYTHNRELLAKDGELAASADCCCSRVKCIWRFEGTWNCSTLVGAVTPGSASFRGCLDVDTMTDTLNEWVYRTRVSGVCKFYYYVAAETCETDVDCSSSPPEDPAAPTSADCSCLDDYYCIWYWTATFDCCTNVATVDPTPVYLACGSQTDINNDVYGTMNEWDPLNYSTEGDPPCDIWTLRYRVATTQPCDAPEDCDEPPTTPPSDPTAADVPCGDPNQCIYKFTGKVYCSSGLGERDDAYTTLCDDPAGYTLDTWLLTGSGGTAPNDYCTYEYYYTEGYHACVTGTCTREPQAVPIPPTGPCGTCAANRRYQLCAGEAPYAYYGSLDVFWSGSHIGGCPGDFSYANPLGVAGCNNTAPWTVRNTSSEALDLVACGTVTVDDMILINGLAKGDPGPCVINSYPDGYVMQASVPAGSTVSVNLLSNCTSGMTGAGTLCFRKSLPSSIVLDSTRGAVVKIDGKCWEYLEDTTDPIDTAYNNDVDASYASCAACESSTNNCNACTPDLPASLYVTVTGYQGASLACRCGTYVNVSGLKLNWVSGCTWSRTRTVSTCGTATYTVSWDIVNGWHLTISWYSHTDTLICTAAMACNPSGLYSAAAYAVCGLAQVPRAVVTL